MTLSEEKRCFICTECGKQIWSIAKITHKLGVELPTHLHTVCYERLKEYEFMYKRLCK